MPDIAVDIGPTPPFEDVTFLERLNDEGGMSRFRVVLGEEETLADLLVHEPDAVPVEFFLDWAKRFGALDLKGVPGIVRIEGAKASKGIIFEHIDGERLSHRIEERGGALAEIDALSIIMQAATTLQAAHLQGIVHGNLSAQNIQLLERSGGLDGVVLTGWAPVEDDEARQTAVRDDIRNLGSLFYLMLTGVLPPSEQSSELEDLEGQTSGAFDDVLMDWVEEDRDLRGMGQAALDAISDAQDFEDVARFLSSLFPHFREQLNVTIDEAGRAIEADRDFMIEVEEQRIRLKELEARQRFIQEWLHERADRIDNIEDELQSMQARVEGLQNLESEVALALGQPQSKSGTRARSIFDPVPTETLSEAELETEEGFTVEDESVPTDDASAPEVHDVPLPQKKAGLLDPNRPNSVQKIVLAAVIGAVVAAIALSQSDDGVQPDATPPPAKMVVVDESTRRDAGPIAQPRSQKTPVKTGTETGAAKDKAPAAIDEAVPAKKAKVAKTLNPAEPMDPVLPKAPRGMVAVRGGLLMSGYAPDQLKKLENICQADLRRMSKAPCRKLGDEATIKSVRVRSFYLDRLEVSQGKYDRCVAAAKCKPIRTRWEVPYQPATGITYEMAIQYCKWRGARLPTFEEWSYSARGPGSTRIFPWGDQGPQDKDATRANYGTYSPAGGRMNRKDRHPYAAPVTVFEKIDSPFGAANLVGNVREWTSSAVDKKMIVAGGGWQSAPFQLRVTRRDLVRPTVSINDLGFRCAIDATQP